MPGWMEKGRCRGASRINHSNYWKCFSFFRLTPRDQSHISRPERRAYELVTRAEWRTLSGGGKKGKKGKKKLAELRPCEK